jgi:transcriptional regulator with XRE-family HTH domain
MPESLGARLRRRREEQRIALSTIAERTKIKSALLEALERDDVSQWPAGIYRRAFIKSYAHAIGLDPDPVVREFLELYPDPEAAVAEAPPPPTGLRGVVHALGSLARLGGRTPAAEATPPSPPGGTLNLHGTVTRPEPAAPPIASLPARPADAAPVSEPIVDPLIEVLCDPVSEPDSDALTNDVEENVQPIASAQVPVEPARPRIEPDLMAVARICTGFARVEDANDLSPLLSQAATTLGASGMIVWVWDSILEALRPVLAHGYPDKVLVQLPTVGRDEDNATAAAFRSAEPCAIHGDQETNGALVVPLMTAAGASGVLAIELSDGREQQDPVQAVARIFAAMLAPLVGVARVSKPDPVEEPVVPPASFRARIARP